MRYLSQILFILLLFSCGKQVNGDKKEEEEVLNIDGSNIQGVYQTTLEALNINTTLGTIGSAGLHRSSDIFKAFVKIYIAQNGVIHRQTIHRGSRCPTIDDDINGDGYIDYREALFVVGNVLVPLDGDLDSQWEGGGYYPVGNGIAGGYFYERTASFSRFFEDLRDVDQNSLDEVDKIPYNQGLTFNNKVILIQGVSTGTVLPDSVDTIGTLERHRSLPVACGVLRKSDKFPAELYDRSDPVTNSNPLPHVRITPRTREHREPVPQPDITPLPDPDPPRRGGLRQRIRRWWRGATGGDTHPTESKRSSVL